MSVHLEKLKSTTLQQISMYSEYFGLHFASIRPHKADLISLASVRSAEKTHVAKNSLHWCQGARCAKRNR